MKKYVKMIGIELCFFCAFALLSAQNGTVLFRQRVNVRALADGIDKTIYSTIDNKKVENQLLLTVTEVNSGNIEIRSGNFKLGKMPFSSLFSCEIPSEMIQHTPEGAYLLDDLPVVYKVAMSKAEAVITGTLDIFTCNLTLAVNGMGKKLSLQLSSAIDDSTTDTAEQETIPISTENKGRQPLR